MVYSPHNIEQIAHFKEKLGNDRIIAISIWKVPNDKDRPHGYKYRLHYGYLDGACIIRYDNEKGKGDHRHFADVEEPYVFVTLWKLLNDFESDVLNHRKEQRKWAKGSKKY